MQAPPREVISAEPIRSPPAADKEMVLALPACGPLPPEASIEPDTESERQFSCTLPARPPLSVSLLPPFVLMAAVETHPLFEYRPKLPPAPLARPYESTRPASTTPLFALTLNPPPEPPSRPTTEIADVSSLVNVPAVMFSVVPLRGSAPRVRIVPAFLRLFDTDTLT